MAAPNLTITVEPAEASSVVYGLLAAKTANDVPNGQLSLVLTLKNNETSSVHLNQVTVLFIGPPSVGPSAITADLTIATNQTTQWVFSASDNIILPVPAPGAIRLDLSCDGFTEPAILTAPLAQYVSPANGGGYAYPAKADDLEQGEFWTGRSAGHGPAGGGTQLFAYDVLVRVYDTASNSWPTSIPGADNTLNENYYCWGKPIYAMADGVVVQFLDGMPANTPPGFPSPTPNPVEGNHLYVQHGPDLALYAHLQAGTLNPDLTSGSNPNGSGAAVAKGQLLGLTGNSGRSSEPHLHFQVNRTTTPWGGPPRPLPFNGIHVLGLSAASAAGWPANSDAPWSAVSAQCLPDVTSAIWPGNLRPGRARLFRALTWAWIIVIGGLMITPGGIDCIVCGPLVTDIIGVVSIVLGVAGFISNALAGRRPGFPPQIDMKDDLHM